LGIAVARGVPVAVAVAGSGVGGVSPGLGVLVSVGAVVGGSVAAVVGVQEVVGETAFVCVGAKVGYAVAVAVVPWAVRCLPSCSVRMLLPTIVHNSTLTTVRPMAA